MSIELVLKYLTSPNFLRGAEMTLLLTVARGCGDIAAARGSVHWSKLNWVPHPKISRFLRNLGWAF